MIHVYAGEGKGKTSAALGLALRACGWDKSIYLVHFLKSCGVESGELRAIKKYKLKIRQRRFAGQVHPIFLKKGQKFSSQKTKQAVIQALSQLEKDVKRFKPEIVIMDEILNVLKIKLISLAQFKRVLKQISGREIILTGRYLIHQVRELADYVTYFKKIRHPYDQGVYARCGIEY